MGSPRPILAALGVVAAFGAFAGGAGRAEAQWDDPRLIAGQVGFHVAVSFVGKLVHHEPVGQALKHSLRDGAFAGGLAHAGYCIAGKHPEWALAGKVLAQKSYLTTKRSVDGLDVFDRSVVTDWELTFAFVHLELHGDKPAVEVDAINAAFSAYYLTHGDPYRFDAKRTLLSGSLVFQNDAPPDRLLGFYVPGVIWIDSTRTGDERIWGHELIHSFQAERGSAIRDWHWGPARFNWLVFASGVPALLAGWPEHDTRLHELEAEGYSGTR